MKRLGNEEKKVQRIEEWKNEEFEKNIQVFSKRIQKDIRTLPFPKFDEIVSTYIWGGVGTGKTIRAVFMMLSFLKDCYVHSIWNNKAIFITVPDLLIKIRGCYNKFSKQSFEETKQLTEIELIDLYSEVDLLILDDFGIEKTTDWALQVLYVIINRRYENEKITIFSSNFNLSELAEKLGDERITSRIQQMCKIVKTNDKNYRE